MIERSNGTLESVLRKSCVNPGELDTPLRLSVHNANQRIIQHLGHSPTEILLGMKPNFLPQFHDEWTSELMNALQSGSYIESPSDHRRAVEDCIAHIVELRVRITKSSEEQKYKEKENCDRGMRNWTSKTHDLFMLHSGKLQPRWRGPFVAEKICR